MNSHHSHPLCFRQHASDWRRRESSCMTTDLKDMQGCLTLPEWEPEHFFPVPKDKTHPSQSVGVPVMSWRSQNGEAMQMRCCSKNSPAAQRQDTAPNPWVWELTQNKGSVLSDGGSLWSLTSATLRKLAWLAGKKPVYFSWSGQCPLHH